MPDLGKDVKKSMETLKKVREALKTLRDMPLKKGLREKKVMEEGIVKKIDSAREQATSLDNIIESIMDGVRSIRTDGDSRFSKAASQRVVKGFLEKDQE